MQTEMRRAAEALGSRRRQNKAKGIEVRRLIIQTEQFPASHDRGFSQTIAIAAVIANPLARHYSEELDDLFAIGQELGRFLGERLAESRGKLRIGEIGKAALIGRAGELEHAVGLAGSTFDIAARRALGLGSGDITSHRELGAAGAIAAVPLASVSPQPSARPLAADGHGIEVRVAGSPREDEALIVLAVSGTLIA